MSMSGPVHVVPYSGKFLPGVKFWLFRQQVQAAKIKPMSEANAALSAVFVKKLRRENRDSAAARHMNSPQSCVHMKKICRNFSAIFWKISCYMVPCLLIGSDNSVHLAYSATIAVYMTLYITYV